MKRSFMWPCLALVWFLLSCYGLFWQVSGDAVPAVAYIDKVAHFCMFFGQFYWLTKIYPPKTNARVASLLGVALVWAVASELIQGYFTARTMDWRDGLADMMGATLAVLMAWHQKRTTRPF